MKRFAVLFLLLGTAAAQDADSERLKLTRLAVEAKLKVGDLLREKGDIEGALKAYREAASIYDSVRAVRVAPRPKVVVKGKVVPKERVVERPIRAAREVSVVDTKKAVDKALQWLVGYQSRDGRWDCDGWMKLDPPGARLDGAGSALFDVGVTSLSLMVFLRTGHGDKDNPHADTVKRGLKFLMDQQGRDGCVGSRASQHYMYNTVLATAALCNAYRITKNGAYKGAAQRAVNYLLKARNPYMAWRYEPRGGENDTSVTALAVQALVAAKFAGLKVDPDAFEGARQWIDKMTDPKFGQVGYNFPGGSAARPEGLQDKFPPEKTASMTAAGILTRIWLGEDPRKHALIQKGAARCAERQPAWDRRGYIDMYYWYLGTKALFQVGGAHWPKWRANVRNHIVSAQDADGSWDPVGPWGPDGGRVYSTAVCALTLVESMRPDKERVFGAGR